MELINRQDAIDALLEEVPSYGLMDNKGNIESGCKDKDVIAMLENLKPVDAEPVRHGQWDYVTVVDEGFWRCSICGTPSEAIGAKILYKYCPFCGAKMREEDGHSK